MGFFKSLFNRPSEQKVSPPVPSPLRDAIIEKHQSITQGADGFAYGLLMTLPYFSFLPQPAFPDHAALNSDEALVYAAFLQAAYLDDYVINKGYGGYIRQTIVYSTLLLCNLYEAIYSNDIPIKGGSKTLEDYEVLKHRMFWDEMLANVLADRILHFGTNKYSMSPSQQAEVTAIARNIRNWIDIMMALPKINIESLPKDMLFGE